MEREREKKRPTSFPRAHKTHARAAAREHTKRERKKEGFDAFFPLLLVKKRESCIYIYIYTFS